MCREKCNTFQLTWIMSRHYLSCETSNAHCAHATVELWQKEIPEISPRVLQIRQIWSQLITVSGKYCKRRCTKQVSLIWSYQWRHWRMSAAMTTWSSFAHSVLSRCFSSSRSVMRILYTFSCNSPHTLWVTGFKSGEFEGHNWDAIYTRVCFCKNSMVARVQWAFHV